METRGGAREGFPLSISIYLMSTTGQGSFMPEICDGSDRLRHGSQSVTVSMAPFDVVTAKHDFFCAAQ